MIDPLDETAAALQSQGRALRTLARAILRSTEGADDVVQDAFATELAARPAPANRMGWLTRVVQNLARRRLRDLARRQHRLDGLPPPPPAPTAEDVLGQVETHRLVAEAVLQLPEPYRRALVLRFWHDLPPRAIARRLDLPVATVKTHLQRALAELRQRLDRRTGDRRAWLCALVPIAKPHLLPAAPLATAAAFAVMNSKLVALVLATCVGLALVAWQPWAPPSPPAPVATAGDRVDAARGVLAADSNAATHTPPAVAATGSPGAERTPAKPAERTCTVVGRIVVANDQPAASGRIRLTNLFEHPSAPPLAAAAAADGTFALAVTRPHDWIPYSFALADAPGYAVRELQIGSEQQKTIADDRLDLGTFRLERGVAVAGRVVEADGSPLRTRARLLVWDPSRSGSVPSMYDGRTVGFAEAGGQFALADRLSAAREGAWILAAVGGSGVGWAKLEFAAGQDHLDPVEIRLLPGGGVAVQVVDSAGRPLADADVVATPYFQPIGLAPGWEPSRAFQWLPNLAEIQALWARHTDAEGRVSFINLPRRQHPSVRDANQNQRTVNAIIVSASKPGWNTNNTTVDPAAGGMAPITIALLRQRRVAFHGTVATPDGTKLPGVQVRYDGYDGSAVTDPDGRYDLPACTIEGSHALFVIEGGGVPRTQAYAAIPPEDDRVAHDFVAELRAPVTGRVVDQSGKPVAGVALHLGIPKGVHYPSSPERTGADGVFAFPDAVPSQVDLWVQPPDPQSAWRPEQSRALARRDGEVITLQRLDGPLVELTIAVADGRNAAPVSPTEVTVQRLRGSAPDYDTAGVQVARSLGAVTAPNLRPGRYRATVRAPDGLTGEREFTLPADAGKHDERMELWPAVAVVCTVDASALPADTLTPWAGKMACVLLDSQREQSYCVDAAGKRRPLTPNTGSVWFGGEMTFRLERVTPNVPLRLRSVHEDLFGEVWFTAAPGVDAQVTLRLVPHGRLAFARPAAWAGRYYEIDVQDGATWRFLARGEHDVDTPLGSWPRPAGEVRWRLRLWPADGGEIVERTGTTTVRAGVTTNAAVN